jgi:hypothetical protein
MEGGGTGRSGARRAGRLGLVLLAHGLLAFCLTYPMALRLHTHVASSGGGDKLMYAWNFWWLRYSLCELGVSPFFTPMQYHPTGTSLALHDMAYFWSLLSVPLQTWAPPITLLNVFMLASFPANGLAFYVFAREVTGEHWGAFAGSVVFAYCPYFLSRMEVGHVSLLGAFFMPLCLLMLWRYAGDPRLRHLVKAGVFFALGTLTHYYYGALLALSLAAFAAYQAVALARRGGVRALRRFALHLAALGAVAGVLLAPVVVPMGLALARGEYDRSAVRSGPAYMGQSNADLVSYFIPDPLFANWRGYTLFPEWNRDLDDFRRSFLGNLTEKSVYPGWVGWTAVLATLLSARLRRRHAVWLLVLGVGFVWSLGPSLDVAGERFLDGWLPAGLLYAVPVLNQMRATSRMAVLVALACGVMVAGGVAALREGRRRAWATPIAVAAALVAALEFWPATSTFIPQRSLASPFFEHLRIDDRHYAVLDVPVDFRDARGGGERYLYAQTIHQKPIVGGYVARETRDALRTRRTSAFLRAVEQRAYRKDRRLRLGEEGLADMVPTLERLGIRYVVLHKALLDHMSRHKDESERVARWLEQVLPPPVYEDDLVRVYEYGGVGRPPGERPRAGS